MPFFQRNTMSTYTYYNEFCNEDFQEKYNIYLIPTHIMNFCNEDSTICSTMDRTLLSLNSCAPPPLAVGLCSAWTSEAATPTELLLRLFICDSNLGKKLKERTQFFELDL